MKIAVVGGGSTYTPELIDGLIAHGRALGVRQVVLHDIDGDRLDIVGGFAARMVAAAGSPFVVTHTLDRREAVSGADFVMTQIRVGGQAARHADIQLGLRHGLIGQETTGVGGFAKALRTIPVLKGLLADMAEWCPKAWLLNFTNPSGLVTEALHRAGWQRLVGLCNIPAGMHMEISTALGVEPSRVRIAYAGANHLAWILRVELDGIDVTERIIESVEAMNAARAAGDPSAHAAVVEDMDYLPGFVRNLGALPSPYLRYFYATGRMLAELRAAKRSRAEEVMAIESELLAQYRNPQLTQKPAALSKRGGAWYSKVAVDVIRAIVTGDEAVATQVVNVPNRTADGSPAIAGLTLNQSVEVAARLGPDGAVALPAPSLPPHLFGLLATVKSYETLAATAALRGCRKTAFQALTCHPLCPPELAETVLSDIIHTFRLDLR